MQFQTRMIVALITALMPGMVLAAGAFTNLFRLPGCTWVTEGNNPYFILEVGRELHFDTSECVAAGDCDELEEVVITVLNETHDVTFNIGTVAKTITTRVVEENESVDGELAEVSRNYFAECKQTRDVYYFGEAVDDYEGGVIVGHSGEWEAGVDNARPGLFMPGGTFLLGARYFQEVAPEVAMDRAENVKMNITRETAAGTFRGCVRVNETTPLEPGELSIKMYCPGVGLVVDDGLELISIVE